MKRSPVDELRRQLRRVIELTDAASARPIPTNADEAGELVAAVDVARQGFMVLGP